MSRIDWTGSWAGVKVLVWFPGPSIVSRYRVAGAPVLAHYYSATAGVR